MARHLLLKNNTVSLSQPVKQEQIQNRGNMRDNYFLTYDERQTAFTKNYGYLILTEYWLTFYKYYIVFWTAFIASRVSPLSGHGQEKKKEEDLGVICSNEPGNETIQQSNWSAGIRFAHVLSGSDLASILKVWNRSFRSHQLVWFPSEVWVHNYASR